MQVGQPIRDPAGRTLLEKGAVLTDDLIARLKKFGVTHLEVEGAVAAGDLTLGTVRDMLTALSEEYPTRTPFGCALELRPHGLAAVEQLSRWMEQPLPAQLPGALGLLGQVAHVFTDAALSDFLPTLDIAEPRLASSHAGTMLLNDDDDGDGGSIPVAGADLPGHDVHDAHVRARVLELGLPPLVRFLEGADERVRLAAARGLESLVALPEPFAGTRREALEKGLHDANPEVVLSCALGLETDEAWLDERGRAHLADAYLQVLTASQSPRRYLAVLGLGRLDAPGARAVLMEMLEEDEGLSVRRSALYALGDLREARALERILELASDDDDGTRAWACRALGRIGDAQAVPVLVRALHDTTDHVFRQAVDALLRMGSRAEAPLIPALTDADWFVRQDICRILGEVGGVRSLPALKIRAANDDHRFVREAALAAVDAILARAKAPG